MAVTVYSKPACGQCRATALKLDRLGVEYRYVDITEDDAGRAAVVSHGFEGVPVIEVAGAEGVAAAWQGYRPESLAALTDDTVDPATLDMRQRTTED